MLKRYLFFLIIPAVLLTCVLPGCTHSNKNVPPTGWMSMGEPYDSLIRRLELGFNGDMPDDSLRYYCKLYQSAAEADGSPLQLSRAAFWRGRMAFRDGNDSLGKREFENALTFVSPESEYLRHKIDWFNENIHDYSRHEWYDFLLKELEYYKARNDWMMLYNRYIDLFNLMRDIGYTAQVEKYLNLSDSAMNQVGKWRSFGGADINRAILLYNIGKKDDAGKLLRKLRADTLRVNDPDVRALIDYNLYMIYGDTTLLDSALINMEATGHNPFNLYPVVLVHKAEAELRAGRVNESVALLKRSRENGADRLGTSDEYLMTLQMDARIKERQGDWQGSLRAMEEYAAAVDSIRLSLEDNELLNREMLMYVDSLERQHMERQRKSERYVWIAIMCSLILLLGGVIAVRRIFRKHRRRQMELIGENRESERRRMALQVAADKQGEVIADTRRHLETLTADDEVRSKEIHTIMQTLREGEKSAVVSETFRELVGRIRPEFISNLKARCPKLGESAIRVACYIYLGLDTKEIAVAMNVRPESVKQARWRLRKALSISADRDLREALKEFDC